MKFEVFEAKTLEDAKKMALETLNVSEDEILSNYEEKKGKLFKAGSVVLKVVTIKEIAEYIHTHNITFEEYYAMFLVK